LNGFICSLFTLSYLPDLTDEEKKKILNDIVETLRMTHNDELPLLYQNIEEEYENDNNGNADETTQGDEYVDTRKSRINRIKPYID